MLIRFDSLKRLLNAAGPNNIDAVNLRMRSQTKPEPFTGLRQVTVTGMERLLQKYGRLTGQRQTNTGSNRVPVARHAFQPQGDPIMTACQLIAATNGCAVRCDWRPINPVAPSKSQSTSATARQSSIKLSPVAADTSAKRWRFVDVCPGIQEATVSFVATK